MADADSASTSASTSVNREDQTPSDVLQEFERFVSSVQDRLSHLRSVSSIPSGDTSDRQRKLPSPTSVDLSSKRNRRQFLRRRLGSDVSHRSPSSSESMLMLAQSSLPENGLMPSIREEVFSVASSAAATTEADSSAALLNVGHSILALGEATAHSLVNAFASNVHVLYPCMSVATIRGNLTNLYHLESRLGSSATTALRLIDVEILKATMLVGASARSSEPSALIRNLEQSLLWSVEDIYSQELVEIDDVVMSFLMCIYFLQCDERRKAWRMAGFGARIGQELNLQMPEAREIRPKHNVDPDRKEVEENSDSRLRSLLFCCIYDLDSWTSFMTGLPRALQLQLPSDLLNYLQSQSHRYLRAMLEMDRIGADIVALLKEPDQAADSLATSIEYLEFRLKNMERTVGLEEASLVGEEQNTAIPTIMQLFIQLRANHLRLLILLRSLGSAKMVATRPRSIEALVGAAGDNVRVCKTATNNGSIPALLKPTLTHFCMAAVSGILLAAAYDSVMYGLKCRRPFETGLEILEDLAQGSQGVDPRHRYSLANLRSLGQRLNISLVGSSDCPINDGSDLDQSTAFALTHEPSFDMDLEQSWNVLRDDVFGIGETNAQTQPWNFPCFDFVFDN